jgi:hypothetical protein
LIPREEMFSLFDYGSRIAGYEEEDYNYDIIIAYFSPKTRFHAYMKIIY